MKKVYPWLLFILCLMTLAGLSVFKDKDPDIYDSFAWVATVIWCGGIILLSALTVYRHGRPRDPANPIGFGIAGLPLPQSWQRWIYDERPEKKTSH